LTQYLDTAKEKNSENPKAHRTGEAGAPVQIDTQHADSICRVTEPHYVIEEPEDDLNLLRKYYLLLFL
jgi:hypothetical protein